jgi:hypothetical protein
MKLLKILCLLIASVVCFAQSKINSVTLTWTWTQGTGVPVTNFNVYRATVATGPFTLVGSTLGTVFTYTDATVTALPTGPFYYYVAAVSTTANLTAPSAVIGVIPAIMIAAPSGVQAAIK